jgi:hypothetical protein
LVTLRRGDKYDMFNMNTELAMGICLYDRCDFSESSTFSTLAANLVTKIGGPNDTIIDYYFPLQVMDQYNHERKDAYWAITSIILLLAIMSILGIFAEKTSLGDRKKEDDDSETNCALSPDMHPVLVRKLNDIHLISNKKIWANFLISFSLTRNLNLLFYPLSVNSKSKNAGYFVVFMGLMWMFLFGTVCAALQSFPKNFITAWIEFTTLPAAIVFSGFSSGLAMMAFGIAYTNSLTLLKTEYF